jgi:hypothetical protein
LNLLRKKFTRERVVKMASPRPKCAMVFATPAESRNACVSNIGDAFARRLDGRLAFLTDRMS